MATRDIAWLLLPETITAVLIAVAAIALFRVVGAVRQGFDRLAGRSREPFVTVSLEPNFGNRDHVDLVVENCGFAPAFDVKVVLTPEIPADEGYEDRRPDWCDVSLLRPNQVMVGYACRADRITGTVFVIEVSWKNRPEAKQRCVLEYRLDMRRYRYQEAFPAPPARDELLAEVRSIRRDWRPLARGDRPLRIELSRKALQAMLEEARSDDRRETRREDRRNARGEQLRDSRGRESEGSENSANAPVPLSEARPLR